MPSKISAEHATGVSIDEEGYKLFGSAKDAAQVEINISEVETGDKTAVFPVKLVFTIPSEDVKNAGYNDLSLDKVTFFKKQVDDGASKFFNVKEEVSPDRYYVRKDGSMEGGYFTVTLNYLIANGVGTAKMQNNYLVVYDGNSNNVLLDPVFLAVKPKDNPPSSSSGGCDAGLGAFALLGLAGAALLSKKK
jgi:hypothetical protein